MSDGASRIDSINGCLLGTAIGDALGLPYEGLSPLRAKRMLGPPDRYRFCFGRGMVSDDTDHALMTAAALLESRHKWDDSGGDSEMAAVPKSGRWDGFRAKKPWPQLSDDWQERFELEWFEAALSQKLKWWLASIPAGVGLATLRSILKLWFGWTPANSGVFSAGNGPAMRAPILGAMIDDLDVLKSFVRCSTRMTHSDPKAEYGALVVALAAYLAARDKQITGRGFLNVISDHLPSGAGELLKLITKCVESVESQQSTQEFANSLGLGNGVTGYMYHTVPVCIQAWLSFPVDFPTAIRCVIACGGDADTTAAITGGIVGASVGAGAMPKPFEERLESGICGWSTIGQSAVLPPEIYKAVFPPKYRCRFTPCRNIFIFLPIVLFHGFRRLLPPY